MTPQLQLDTARTVSTCSSPPNHVDGVDTSSSTNAIVVGGHRRAQPDGDDQIESTRPGRFGRFRTHALASVYFRLIALSAMVNVFVLVFRRDQWLLGDGSAFRAFGDLALVNLAAAILVRQQLILNVLYTAVSHGSSRWPLRLRWVLSKVHHVGGFHAGFAMSGVAWLIALAAAGVLTGLRHPNTLTGPTVVLSVVLAAVLLIVVFGALPPVRYRFHDVFEATHRWGGWSALALFWVLLIHVTVHTNPGTNPALAVLAEWRVWLLTVATLSVASPWLRLRRVPITVHRPSSHVAIVEFDHGTRPSFPAAVGISHSPLKEWHPFATITSPDRRGFRIVISRAGDWTGRFIDDPPDHVWIRGVPVTAPMARAAMLYKRIVYVATGSGVGPLLGQIIANRVPARLVWSTRDPRRTYGDALVDEVLGAQPNALIWDTTAAGKPDLVQLAIDATEETGAEAVFIVSNKPTTLNIVTELERHGIPAFGPVWDS